MMKLKQDIAEMGAQNGICLLFSLVSSRSAAALRLFPLTVSQQSQRIFRKPKTFLLIGNPRKCRLILDLKPLITAGAVMP